MKSTCVFILATSVLFLASQPAWAGGDLPARVAALEAKLAAIGRILSSEVAEASLDSKGSIDVAPFFEPQCGRKRNKLWAACTGNGTCDVSLDALRPYLTWSAAVQVGGFAYIAENAKDTNGRNHSSCLPNTPLRIRRALTNSDLYIEFMCAPGAYFSGARVLLPELMYNSTTRQCIDVITNTPRCVPLSPATFAQFTTAMEKLYSPTGDCGIDIFS